MTFDLMHTIYGVVKGEIKLQTPMWKWMVVDSVSPLRIKFDLEDDPLDLEPDSLVDSLKVGDRVLVKIKSNELPVVMGGSDLGIMRRNAYGEIPDGTQDNVYIGTSTNNATPSLWLISSVGRARIYPSSGQLTFLYQTPAGDNTSILRLYDSGQVSTYTYSDTKWRPLPFAVATGTVSFGSVDPNSATNASVTFPSGRFTSAPTVMATNTPTGGSGQRATVTAGDISASGFTMRVSNWTSVATTAHTVAWLAIQPEA